MQQQQGFLLAGSVFFGDVGATEYFYPAGESDKLETQPENEAKTITSKQEKTYGQVVTAVYLPKPTKISISLFELNRLNLVKAFLGTDTDITEIAGTASFEKLLAAGQTLRLPHRFLSSILVGEQAIASTTTGVVGDKNALKWSAKTAGLSGNEISITLIKPATNNAVLTVSVVNTDVKVSLATDVDGNITSTAAQVIIAVQAHTAANRTISVANDSTSDGTGVLTAVAKTSLTGGLGYEINKDFTVNLGAGTIKTVAGTRIPNTVVLLEYQYQQYEGFEIAGAVNYAIETAILLTGKNLANNQRAEFYAPRAIVAPLSPVNFLSADLVKLDLVGTLNLYEEQSPFKYTEIGVTV